MFNRRRPLWYILVNGVPEPVEHLGVWEQWLASEEGRQQRVLRQSSITPQIGLSTVFLGLDHNYAGEGKPILWETLVFGGSYDGEGRRAASAEEALANHQRFLTLICDAAGVSEENVSEVSLWDGAARVAGDALADHDLAVIREMWAGAQFNEVDNGSGVDDDTHVVGELDGLGIPDWIDRGLALGGNLPAGTEPSQTDED